MDILKNSYVIAILTFLVVYYVFYVLGIGYRTFQDGNKTIKDMSIKFPLLFAFGIWLIWHFILFPHPSVTYTALPVAKSGGPVMMKKMWH